MIYKNKKDYKNIHNNSLLIAKGRHRQLALNPSPHFEKETSSNAEVTHTKKHLSIAELQHLTLLWECLIYC